MLDVFKLEPEKPLVYIEMTGTHAAVATLEEELLQSAPATFKIAYLHLKNANKQPHVTYGYATQDTVKEETLTGNSQKSVTKNAWHKKETLTNVKTRNWCFA